MARLKEKIESILTAVTFAEVGEHETALSFLQEHQGQEKITSTVSTREMPVHTCKPIGVIEKLEKHFMAAAFAEGGDFETARQILPDYKRAQTVLLAIEGEFPNEATFDYAFSLCKRINASLDILQMKSKNLPDENGTSDGLSALLPRLEDEGISYKITVKEAGVKESLFGYVQAHKDVVTAVLDSPRLASRKTENISWRQAIRIMADKLTVPLVTVSQKK